uniref:SET DOMAIN GROUP 29 family protein n=1 Tax=Rhizophora mucronata TaxID=61149 RepID=A0A2P2JFH9_RHIMU
MEPALGILSIPSNSFVKICVICKQIHGSCTQCCKCSTYFHAMCASRAGYRMELHCLEKNGKQTTKMVSYCAYHRCIILLSNHEFDNLHISLSSRINFNLRLLSVYT